MAVIIEKIKVINSHNVKITQTDLNSFLAIKRKEWFETKIDRKIDEIIKIVASEIV